MRTPSRGTATLLAGVVLAALLPAAAAPAAPAGPAAPAAPAAPGPRGPDSDPDSDPAGPTVAAGARPTTVTLITGDRVTVVGNQAIDVQPGPGRTGMRFGASTARGRLTVVPSDALPHLGAGRLDPRLFDVTTLIEFGYHDAARTDLPLIVTGTPAVTHGRTAALAGVTGARAVPGGTALTASKADAGGVWRGLSAQLAARTPGLSKVWLDGLRKPLLDRSVPQTGAPAAWAAGYTGAGVKVAVVDSGIDTTHPDLAGRVVAQRDFFGGRDTRDLVGHGTHVAAIIASGGRYGGVAPGAQLISAKVCQPYCPESAVLAGMQWSVEQGARIVNISLGAADDPVIDPVEAAVDELTARHGVLFVIAAGNAGARETINTPGTAGSALTVGAVDPIGLLAGFSSRGPTLRDAAAKPDISAPGVDVVAARGKDSPGNADERHITRSGTSMATPHVTGAAAILAQRHPQWSAGMLKAALMGSARPHAGTPVDGQGAGQLDVARAIGQSVVAEPASVSFGRQSGGAGPVERTLTYRNLGAAATTLELAVRPDPGVPAGLARLSTDRLRIPPGGAATVTLTVDPAAATSEAFYGGHVVAVAAGTEVSTPFGVRKASPEVQLTVTHVDRAGAPAANPWTLLVEPHTGRIIPVYESTMTLSVPRGRYALLSMLFEPESGATTFLVDPQLPLDADRALTLDARTARPVSISVPQADAGTPQATVAATVSSAENRADQAQLTNFRQPVDTLYVGAPDPERRNPLVDSVISGYWAKAGPVVYSPYLGQFAWRERGRMFPGLQKPIGADELAVVEADYGAQTPAFGYLRTANTWPDGLTRPFFEGTPLSLPGRRLEYHTADDGVRWATRLFDGAGTWLDGPWTDYVAGRRYPERRNHAVFGPGFAETAPDGVGAATRRRNTIALSPELRTDRLDWAGLPVDAVTRLKLDRDGQRLLDRLMRADQVPSDTRLVHRVSVAPGAAQYRLSVEQTTTANAVSTTVSCVWTFRSGTAPGSQPVPLPLLAVRFDASLNPDHSAPAGQRFAVAVDVRAQPGSAANPRRLQQLTVEVSYDDGATWRPAQLVRKIHQGLAMLEHPPGPGFVSLRAKAVDAGGHSVEQTVIRAYRLT